MQNSAEPKNDKRAGSKNNQTEVSQELRHLNFLVAYRVSYWAERTCRRVQTVHDAWGWVR
jgi:hypothetical protein